jgi:sialate O-acetylesterase
MRLISLFFLFAFVQSVSYSQLRLPSVLSPGIVLQQNDSANLWGWANPGERITVSESWDNQIAGVTAPADGRWKLKIKTPGAGGPYIITVKGWSMPIQLTDVMIGEVWVCSGQSNMEWSYYNGAKYIKEEFPTCYNKNIRFFHIPRTSAQYPQDDVRAEWKICDSNSLKSFSAVGYFFGKKLNQDLNIPVGLINASWGGTPAETWTPEETIRSNSILNEAANILTEVPWGPIKPARLYNGMIAPVTPFQIAGAIWYQGESNTQNNGTYSQLLTAMIDAWRKSWHKEFPFYFVQIAPYKYGNNNAGALIQEQQTKTLSHTKTGMVVITDLIDSVTNIHPSDKRWVGARLANWALGETYGSKDVNYKNPMYKSMEVKNNTIVLSFDNIPAGIVAKDKNIRGFFISGDKEQWLPAEVKIVNNQVIVWNKTITAPAQVRYGFGNTITGNIFSKEGLPLCPFRTDNWPVDQSPVK